MLRKQRRLSAAQLPRSSIHLLILHLIEHISNDGIHLKGSKRPIIRRLLCQFQYIQIFLLIN